MFEYSNARFFFVANPIKAREKNLKRKEKKKFKSVKY
jgi:hypothetical protein